jgi:hypothetical protein
MTVICQRNRSTWVIICPAFAFFSCQLNWHTVTVVQITGCDREKIDVMHSLGQLFYIIPVGILQERDLNQNNEKRDTATIFRQQRISKDDRLLAGYQKADTNEYNRPQRQPDRVPARKTAIPQ